jgi:hypothetical protein
LLCYLKKRFLLPAGAVPLAYPVACGMPDFTRHILFNLFNVLGANRQFYDLAYDLLM